MDADRYIVCRREKSHIYVRLPETFPVSMIRDILQQLLLLNEKPKIKMPTNADLTQWIDLDENESLKSIGITVKNAKPNDPFIVAYVLPEDGNEVKLAELATTPKELLFPEDFGSQKS